MEFAASAWSDGFIISKMRGEIAADDMFFDGASSNFGFSTMF
jgi:hypothetical protein